MRRTAGRPLPAGRLIAGRALAFGIALSVAGFLELWLGVNLLSAADRRLHAGQLSVPLHADEAAHLVEHHGGRDSGRHAAADRLRRRRRHAHRAKRWVLFAILFLWQFPHFYAIAWMYNDDYARAGIRMLPVVEPDGRSTARQIVLYGIALIPVSLVPAYAGNVRTHLPDRRLAARASGSSTPACAWRWTAPWCARAACCSPRCCTCPLIYGLMLLDRPGL